MKKLMKWIPLFIMLVMLGTGAVAMSAQAAEAETVVSEAAPAISNTTQTKAIAAAVVVGVVASIGALAMGASIVKAEESIARQPEAEGGIRTTFMLGLVFIETAIIYALIVAILIIFVL